MPNMVGANLSQQQFGATQPAQAQQATAPNPTTGFMQPPSIPAPPQSLNMGRPHQPHSEMTGEAPLSVMSGAYGSIKTAAAWRQPRGRVLPLGKGTFGSVFNPFGE